MDGVFLLRDASSILLKPARDPLLVGAAKGLRKLVRVRPDRCGVITLQRDPRGHGDQSYSLKIRSDRIHLQASGEAGFRYGLLTLTQLIRANRPGIQAMDIEDWPDFPVRGVMLDISRDKVPTLGTLKRLIEMLAGWKINQLQLYMEHTFAYTGHEEVWRGASPLTGSQARELDRLCHGHGIELVPNQNSFGHMERWLKHRRYARLAECTGPWKTPWGEVRRKPSTLNPLHRDSARLVSSLYDQLLPNFSSKRLNVGCDEPWEIGQGRSRGACERQGAGRVYFDYLMKIRRAAGRHGSRILCWSDWIFKYPDLIQELPDDVTPLVWGYEADHPFDRQCARLRSQDLNYYVCPGTSSWCSFGGRTRNCLANLRNAAMQGRRHRAEGYLITDWGDYGHRQYLPVSYAGFLYGAALAWCAKTNVNLDVASELSRHVFEDPTGISGQVWLDAGRVPDLSGVVLNNRSLLFACMQASLGDVSSVEGLAAGKAERMAKRIAELKSAVSKARFGGVDRGLVKEELRVTLAVMNHACQRAQYNVAGRTGGPMRISVRRLEADLERLTERHRAVWLARNRRGGLASSVGYYERNLKEYQALTR